MQAPGCITGVLRSWIGMLPLLVALTYHASCGQKMVAQGACL
jgi:hypothetical protein